MDESVNEHFTEWLESKKVRIDTFMDQFLLKKTPDGVLGDAIRYGVFGGGKRVRPLLSYATAEALDLDLSVIDFPAAALEFLHSYSLIHDDLPAMDNDDLRRGRPTVHKQFGEATAILAGDALLTLAFEVLSADGALSSRVPAWTNILARAGGANGMIYGQILDLIGEISELSVQELESIHKAKTGALISASVRPVTVLKPELNVSMLHEFASHLGLCFQIRDDLLDVQGETEIIGKPVGSDERNKKATFVTIMGERKAEQRLYRELEGALECLQKMDQDTMHLENIANYIVHRAH